MSDLVFRCNSCGGINKVKSSRLEDQPKCGRCKADLDISGKPIEVDDETLNKIIASSPIPVLVDFWAPWCGPCRMVGPHIEALAKENSGRLMVLKVNTDVNQRTAASLNIRGIPTLGVWKDGIQQKLQAGALTGNALKAFVAPYLV